MHNPVKIIQCPTCEQKYRNGSVIYWLEHHNKIWSDGYRSCDISNELPLITRCDECYSYFWIAPVSNPSGRKSGLVWLSLNPIHSPGKFSIQPVRKLAPEEFAEVLALKKFTSPEEERYLRIQLWWAINYPLRNGKPLEISVEMAELFEENLETLIYKTPANGPENLLTLAEMNRELGQYREALQYLDRVRDPDYRPIIQKLRQKITLEDRWVFLL